MVLSTTWGASSTIIGAIRRVKSAARPVAFGSKVATIGCGGDCSATRAAACLPPPRSRWPIQAAQNPFGSFDPHPACNARRRDRQKHGRYFIPSPSFACVPVWVIAPRTRLPNFQGLVLTGKLEVIRLTTNSTLPASCRFRSSACRDHSHSCSRQFSWRPARTHLHGATEREIRHLNEFMAWVSAGAAPGKLPRTGLLGN